MPGKKQAGIDRKQFPRRSFLRAAAVVTTTAYFSPAMLLACDSPLVASNNADAMDEALELMRGLAPLTNHGPMAAEALIALGRSESVLSFVEGYKKRFSSIYPNASRKVTSENWREALGDSRRVADWVHFFDDQLAEASYKQVLEEWSPLLAPGLSAAAAHGLIRTAHAARSLSIQDTALRRHELAEGLSYWAAYHQVLPETPEAKGQRMKPMQAIQHVPLLPEEKRSNRGSIMLGLQSLSNFVPFGPVANLLEISGDPNRFLTQMTETFVSVYLKNVHRQNFITLIHTVTGTTALRSLLPYLSPSSTEKMLRYAWQMAAALYSISGVSSANALADEREIKQEDLVDRAVVSQDEHAIKFTESCLREYILHPNPLYLQAANDAVERIRK